MTSHVDVLVVAAMAEEAAAVSSLCTDLRALAHPFAGGGKGRGAGSSGEVSASAGTLECAHRCAYLAGRARTAPLPAAREWVSDRAKVGAEGRDGGSLFSHRRDNENINVRSHGASIS